MTVGTFTDSANRLTFTADSSTASFTFNFVIADSNSIEVYVDNVLKTLTTDYTITFDSGTSGTGSVVFNSAPTASATIILKRDTLLVRSTDFQTSGSFIASTVNAEFDRITQGLQEADDKIQNRVLRVDNFSSAPTDFTIPSSRGDMYLKFDSGGDVTVTNSFEGSTITASGNVSVGGDLSVTGALSLASLSVSGNISGTLTTAAQTNITSLGTLTALTVDNINLNGNTIVSDTGTLAIDDNTTVNGTIVASGAITGSTLTGTLQTAAQTNITSIGTLSALTVDNVTVNGNQIVSDTGTLAIDDNTTVNGSLTATTLAGTISTAAQTNITSLGTLSSLAVSGSSTLDGITINDNNISATRSNDNLNLIPSGTGSVAVSGTLSATTLGGTLSTAAQGNVTSLGTLTALTVDNININGNTISATSGDLTLSNLTSVSIDDIQFKDNEISTTASNANLDLKANGTGNIDVTNHKIVNLADAVDNKDAVSKGFMNTTLINAGVSPTGGVVFQSTIESGSSKVEVESTDGDVHITLASSLLYKFEGAEIESINPIRLTDNGYYSHNNAFDTTTFTLPATSNNFLIGEITVNSGETMTLAGSGSLRII
ncbi:tail fiber protein [uncultured Mediterranean phage]|nr:tail fiber protein [uncultured Mediterranean phage]